MIRILLSICFLILTSTSSAQETKEFSLENAINYGLKNNASLVNAKLDEEIRIKLTKENVSLGLPQIKAKFDYNYAFKQGVSVIPAESFGPQQTEPQEVIFSQPHNAFAGIEATQLIFDTRYFFGLKATKGIKQIAALSSQYTKANIEKEIALAYYAVVVTRNTSKSLKENEAVLLKLHNETNEMYKEGLVDELSVNRLELNLSNLKTNINNNLIDQENALLNLKHLLGFPLEEELILSDNLETLMSSTTIEATDEGSYENRVEYSMMQIQDELNGYDVKRNLSSLYPNIYAYANYGTTAQRAEFNFFEDKKWYQSGLVGFVVNVPIFDGLKAHYQAQQTKLGKQKNLNDIENFKKSYKLQITIAKNQLLAAQNQYESQKENKALAEKIFSKTNIMFSEGIGSSFELSQAQTAVTTSQINYSVAIYNLIVARYNLKSALKNN